MKTHLSLLLFLFLSSSFLVSPSWAQGEPDKVPDTLYETPKPSGPVVFLETFNDDGWTSIWKPSTDPKYTGDFEVQESDYVRVSGDRGLVVENVAKHHAIGALFPKPLDNTGKDLVVQYEVQLQKGLECGGAYLKLLTDVPDLDISEVTGDSQYTIMFGPDKCGHDEKLHFIIRHKNPLNHTIEEKHLVPRPKIKTDKLTHLYTLFIRKDNSFQVFIDQEAVYTGNLLEDLTPPVNPPKEIDDITDSKPSDWVDDEFIPDPEAKKPEDWDEDEPMRIPDTTDSKPEDWLDDAPETISDPTAVKPADWNDEEDGEWIAPTIPNPACEEHGCGEWTPRMIKNPKYRGKWTRPNIKNPLYKGIWKPKQIPNPHFFEDSHPSNFPKMAGIAFELWTMTDGILFDNILIAHDKAVADDFAAKTWAVKYAAEKAKYDQEHPSPVEAAEGILETLKGYLHIAYQVALENPYVIGAAVVVGLIPIFVCSAIAPPPRKPATPAPAQASSSNSTATPATQQKVEKEEEVDGEITVDKTIETKKSPVTRKRVPRAKD